MYEYPFGNGQQLNLDWFLAEWKNLLAAWEAEKNGIEGALQAEIDRAEAALADVFSARDAAAQSASNADASERAAAQSASDASGYLSDVQQNATAAQDAARNAAQSETAAGNSASAAAQSQTAAGNSASAAAQSQTAAGNSASAAAQSETAAGNSASAAAQSETAAGNSASAAAQSASDAEDAAASVEASAQQITTNTNDISDLKESIIEYDLTYPFSIEQGYYGAIDGLPNTSTTWCRSKYYVQNDIALYDTFTNIGVQIMILAYDKLTHEYIGLWNPSQQSFIKEFDQLNFVTSVNIADFCSKYPNYYFHLNFYRGVGVTPKYIYSNIVFTSNYSSHNIIAKQIPSMIADTNLVPNDLRIVNNTLFRVTANIANGGTLIVGTNVTTTRVADILKSLLN